MKIIFTLAVGALTAFTLQAQVDTIIHENFNEAGIEDRISTGEFPEGTPNATFLNFDVDGLGDASGGGFSEEWGLTTGFANNADSIDTVYYANSWINDPFTAENWLMSPPVFLSDDSGVLTWESAPRQTPSYLDGYIVVISTTDNIETSFTDTVFVAAEYISNNDPNETGNFSLYTFSEGWVHGMDGNYIMYNDTTEIDSTIYTGILAPHEVSLAAYAGKTIYIAIVHNSTDDYLISIDDITVTGNGSTFSVEEVTANGGFDVYPNPATENVTFTYDLAKSGTVSLEVYDMTGKMVDRAMAMNQLAGQHTRNYNVSNLASGVYMARLKTATGTKEMKLIVE
jgi:hypothetical protein